MSSSKIGGYHKNYVWRLQLPWLLLPWLRTGWQSFLFPSLLSPPFPTPSLFSPSLSISSFFFPVFFTLCGQPIIYRIRIRSFITNYLIYTKIGNISLVAFHWGYFGQNRSTLLTIFMRRRQWKNTKWVCGNICTSQVSVVKLTEIAVWHIHGAAWKYSNVVQNKLCYTQAKTKNR